VAQHDADQVIVVPATLMVVLLMLVVFLAVEYSQVENVAHANAN
jgi:hypothetical protein